MAGETPTKESSDDRAFDIDPMAHTALLEQAANAFDQHAAVDKVSSAMEKREAEKREAAHGALLGNVETLLALLNSGGDGSLSADQMLRLDQAIKTVLNGVRNNVPRVADATYTPPLTVATSVVR